MTRREQMLKAQRERADRKRGVVRKGIEKYIEGFEAQIENRFAKGNGGGTTAPYVAHTPCGVFRRPRQMWIAGWNSAVVVEFMIHELGVARAEGGKALACGERCMLKESRYEIPFGCICLGDGLMGMHCDAAEHARLKPPDPAHAPACICLECELRTAERKAWDSLGRYKFQMFGYWASIWVHLNQELDEERAVLLMQLGVEKDPALKSLYKELIFSLEKDIDTLKVFGTVEKRVSQ